MLTEKYNETLKSSIFEALAEEGFRPRIDEDDDIAFRYESQKIYLQFDANDPGYLRFILPAIYRVEDSDGLNRSYIAASYANERCKGSKVFVLCEESVWVTVECFVVDLSSYRSEVLTRQLLMLRAGANTFIEKLQELEAVSNVTAGVIH